MERIRGTALLDGRLTPAQVSFDDRIRAIEPLAAQVPSGLEAHAERPWLLPGFIDVHVHGGGGGDVMDGEEGVRTLARTHLRHGTTTLIPTTITRPWPEVLSALRAVRRVATTAASEPLPDLPGAHLEGPFLNPSRLGAQPPHAIPADAERVRQALATEALTVVTIAPEIEGALAAVRTFAAAGVRVSFGHTRADASEVRTAAAAVREAGGVVAFTHLFNAMGGMAGRAPGVVGAALADRDAYAEAILDLHHLDPVTFLAAYAAKRERLLLVTDAMRAAGAGEGDFDLGGQQVHVHCGAARLADGTLAGSVLTMDRAFAHARALGLTAGEASWAASGAPAAYLGLADRGALRLGARADLVVLGEEDRPLRTYAAGRGTDAA